MRDLIERLERATGPSVSLSMAIWCALNPDQDAFTYNGDPRWQPYTASIDAAVTLIPKDTCIALKGLNQSWHVSINSSPQQPHHPPRDGFASSAAIAICIAALKARVAMSSGDLALSAADGGSKP